MIGHEATDSFIVDTIRVGVYGPYIATFKRNNRFQFTRFEGNESFNRKLSIRRVMAFVQKAVARLYEPEKLEALLRELGKKHYGYGAKQNYVDVSIKFRLSNNIVLVFSSRFSIH